MHHFQYRNNELHCEEIPVADIAKDVGTPFYLYSYATLRRHFKAFDDAFEGIRHLTCFSMKSNSNLDPNGEPDYNKIPQERFDQLLTTIVGKQTGSALMTIPGLYEVVSEHFNNDVLDEWGKEQLR